MKAARVQAFIQKNPRMVESVLVVQNVLTFSKTLVHQSLLLTCKAAAEKKS